MNYMKFEVELLTSSLLSSSISTYSSFVPTCLQNIAMRKCGNTYMALLLIIHSFPLPHKHPLLLTVQGGSSCGSCVSLCSACCLCKMLVRMCVQLYHELFPLQDKCAAAPHVRTQTSQIICSMSQTCQGVVPLPSMGARLKVHQTCLMKARQSKQVIT